MCVCLCCLKMVKKNKGRLIWTIEKAFVGEVCFLLFHINTAPEERWLKSPRLDLTSNGRPLVQKSSPRPDFHLKTIGSKVLTSNCPRPNDHWSDQVEARTFEPTVLWGVNWRRGLCQWSSGGSQVNATLLKQWSSGPGTDDDFGTNGLQVEVRSKRDFWTNGL